MKLPSFSIKEMIASDVGNSLISTLSFVTPAYRGDLERFACLRRSLRLFAPQIRHFALLDEEDLPLFRERFCAEKGLELIGSRMLLPRRVEFMRKFSFSPLAKLARRIAWRIGYNANTVRGWKTQQLLKLHFLAESPSESVAFLDSDILLVAPVTRTDFFHGNNLLLLETPARNSEDFAFDISTHALLRHPLHRITQLYNYIHQAPRFRRSTAQKLLVSLASANRDWELEFFQQEMPSEYNLLGYGARELDSYQGYQVHSGQPDTWAYRVQHRGDEKELDALVTQCLEEGGKRKFFLIQSNLGIPTHQWLPPVERLLAELSATYQVQAASA